MLLCCAVQLVQHLGDFPLRLHQRWGQVWDYAPLPPVSYPELAGEMWCHRYYLRRCGDRCFLPGPLYCHPAMIVLPLCSMCDEVKFKGWQIRDHVQLLQVWEGCGRGQRVSEV